MGRYGEPWKVSDFVRHPGAEEDDGRIIDPSDLSRAVACVNAMVGLNPKEVRDVIDLLLESGVWCQGSLERCGKCWHCRFEDCKEEETEK